MERERKKRKHRMQVQDKEPTKENIIYDSLLGCPDNKVVNLSSFPLKELHIQILN